MRHHLRTVTLSFAVAAVALTGCGSDAKKADTTTAASVATDGTDAVDLPATTNAPATPAEVAGGKATITVTVGTDDFETSGGTRVVSVPKGTDVTIELTDAASAQEYHLHGYDIEVSAEKGATGTLQFTADQAGQFDLESHDTEATLLVLLVV